MRAVKISKKNFFNYYILLGDVLGKLAKAKRYLFLYKPQIFKGHIVVNWQGSPAKSAPCEILCEETKATTILYVFLGFSAGDVKVYTDDKGIERYAISTEPAKKMENIGEPQLEASQKPRETEPEPEASQNTFLFLTQEQAEVLLGGPENLMRAIVRGDVKIVTDDKGIERYSQKMKNK